MQNTNTIHGLFHIPDEGSFLKKLILHNPTIYNPDILTAFQTLHQVYPELRLITQENYFSLMLPTQSEGISLEAMLISTNNGEKTLLSIYHRLHFDESIYPQGPYLVEADAFLDFNTIMVNTPYNHRIDGLVSLLNYQIQEALNIEITMLCLADADTQIVQENIQPFIHNALSRYRLASCLDNLEYLSPKDTDSLSQLICEYCDLPLSDVLIGIETLNNLETEIGETEECYIPQFASSTLCMMLLLIEQKTSSALLEQGGLHRIQEFLSEQKRIYGLEDITSTGNILGSFKQLN